MERLLLFDEQYERPSDGEHPYVFAYRTVGGGAENRTPVHESPLIGISKLSRWFSLGRFARSDTLAASQPVRS